MFPTLLLALALTATAQEIPAPEPVPAAPAPLPEAARGPEIELDAELLPEYLQGQKILVGLRVNNRSDTGARVFPDLVNRPWLVKFELVLAGGKKERRFTTPPAADPGGTWSIPKGSHRRVLLEIPSSGVLPLGDHQLTITVVGRDGELTLGPHSFHIARPRPTVTSGPWDAPLAEKVGQHLVWIHKAKDSHELYLMHTDPADPRIVVGNYHLASLAEPVTPFLTLALPSQGWSRHVYWQESDRRIGLVQLEGAGRTPARFSVDAPWPRLSLLGTGVSDAGGGMHVPVWVPAPNGKGGEVRVLEWRRRRVPFFRRVVRLKHAPDTVTTGIDGSGNLRMVLHHDGHADLYTVDVAAQHELPAKGLRLKEAEGQGNVRAAVFGILPAVAGWTGGRALMLLEEVSGEEGERRVRARWLSMSGATLYTGPSHPWKATYQVDSLLPLGADDFAAVLRTEGGEWQVISAGGQARVVPADVRPELQADSEGNIWVRGLVGGRALIKATKVASAP